MRRRRFIKATGATALAGLTAGCTGTGFVSDGTESPMDTPTGTDPPTDTATETPTETETETETGSPTETEREDSLDLDGTVGDTEENLAVTSHELYEVDGEVGLRGTVKNTGEEPFGYVQVEVTLQDDEGDVLYEFIDETEGEDVITLKSGNTWQFDVVFQEAKMSQVTDYSIEVDGYRVPGTDLAPIDSDADLQDPNLELLGSYFVRRDDEAFVVGDIKNVGEEPIETIDVSVTLYENETNAFADVTRTVEEDEGIQQLAPGRIWEFEVDFEDVDIESVGRYVISAEGTPA